MKMLEQFEGFLDPVPLVDCPVKGLFLPADFAWEDLGDDLDLADPDIEEVLERLLKHGRIVTSDGSPVSTGGLEKLPKLAKSRVTYSVIATAVSGGVVPKTKDPERSTRSSKPRTGAV